MIAVDDGISSGNFNAADVFFLIGAILGVVAAVCYAVVSVPAARWAPVALSVAVGFAAFGLFLL